MNLMVTIKLLRLLILLSLFLSSATNSRAQTLATVGDDFWLGFMNNTGSSNEELRLFITSQVATSGTINIPLMGWSANFTVVPNITTTVIVPIAFGETLTNDQVDTKGIHVVSNDPISLFAINFSIFSADASKILPTQSLGTDYLVSAYPGIPGNTRSELLIVATENNTQIEITPSVTTQGGFPAGIPYTINLEEGECYQIRSNSTLGDLTGTRITGTLTSGDCRPFAVFAGAQCANVPTNCTTCDHLFDQQFPSFVWGTEYYMPPFETTGVYTYRVLAKDNGTLVSIDGGAPQNLNAGQFIEINNESQPRQITSNLPVQVIQLMQGDNCSLNGDPAMLILNAHDQKISNVTFSTVASSVITDHYLNIVVATSDVGTVLLDNTPIATGNFSTFPGNPSTSFASVPVTQGSHNIYTPNGFTAYLYGMGTAESYAYSLGSFKEQLPIPVDSVVCASGAVTLIPPINLFQPEWYAISDSSQILSTSNSLVLNNVPQVTDVYVVEGFSPLSGCPDSYSFSVASPGSVSLDIFASEDTVCSFESLIVSVNVLDTGTFEFQWNPSNVFSNPTGDSTELIPFNSGWYGVNVQNVGGGCVSGSDSVFVFVEPSNIQSAVVLSSDTLICFPDTATLSAVVNEIVFIEEFDGLAISPLWNTSVGGFLDATCGSVSGNAFLFNAGPTRELVTQDFDLSSGGNLQFYLKIANGVAPCDDAEFGEDVILEYSTNGGVTWNIWTTLFEFNYPNATLVNLPIPAGAQTPSTRIRWSQPNFSAINEDVWWLDNVLVTSTNASVTSYNWSPTAPLTNPTGASTQVIPSVSDWYVLEVGTGNCSYKDSVFIEVSQPFTLDLFQDTLLCGNQSVQLEAQLSQVSNPSVIWEPAGVFSSISGTIATVVPNTDTTVYVTVISPNGCHQEIDSAVIQNQFLDVTLLGSPSVCYGTPQNLQAVLTGSTANLNVEWFEAGTLIGSNSLIISYTPFVTGWVKVVISDPVSGCNWSDSLFVNVIDFNVDAGPDVVLCETTGYTLQGSTSVFNPNVSWSNAGNLSNANVLNPVITQNTSASYILSINNGFCTVNDTVNITYSPPIKPYVPNDTTVCAGNAVQVDLTGAVNPVWQPNIGISNSGSVYTIQPIGSILYTLSYTSSNGCPVQDTLDLTVINLPSVSLPADSTLCPGESILISPIVTPFGGAFNWSNGQTSQSISVNSPGAYWLDYTNVCGAASDTIEIDYHPAYTFSLGNDTTVCLNDTVLFQPVIPSNGSIVWNTNFSSPSYVSSSAELITVVVDDGNGCLQFDTVEVFNYPEIQFNLPANVMICDGDFATLDASSQQAVSYQWSTNETTPWIQVSAAGNYQVVLTDVFGCEMEGVSNVGIWTLPSPDILGPVDYCSNESIVYSVSGTYSQYEWSNGALTATTTVTGIQNEISVLVTDINGCQGSDTLALAPINVPELDLGPDITLCDTAVVTLDGSVAGASGYLWSPNGSTSSSIDALPGVYQLLVMYQTCEILDTIVISVEPFELDLGEDRTICKDDDILIVQSMLNIDSLIWDDGATGGWYIQPTTSIFEDSVYISATAYGCEVQQDTLKVVLVDCDCDFYVPNTFTPDGDGINELFRVYQDCPMELFEIQIFNRWGAIVFESNDLDFGWDGRLPDGTFVQDGVYTWKVRFLAEYLDEVQYEELHGHLNVLR